MDTLFINGKFGAQRMTGVQRYASELLRALDAEPGLVATLGRCVLLVPPGAQVPPLRHIEVEVLGPEGLPLHLWEQLLLPWRARSGRLLNLSGSAPALARRRIATLHDAAMFDWPEAYTPLFRGWYRMLFRRMARQDPLLLTVSAFSRERLAHRLSLPPQRVAVVPGAGEHLGRVEPVAELLPQLGLQPQGYWLCVASQNHTKGLDLLLAAWAAHAAGGSERTLVLVGGQRASVFAATGPAPSPGGAVRHLGPRSDAELVTLLHGAFALVLPSRYEGFGLPLLEAMGLGCPVLASRAGALPEVGGDAALWVPPEDSAALAAAMARLEGSPALRTQLVAAGHRRAAAFSWSASARVLREALIRGRLGQADAR